MFWYSIEYQKIPSSIRPFCRMMTHLISIRYRSWLKTKTLLMTHKKSEINETMKFVIFNEWKKKKNTNEYWSFILYLLITISKMKSGFLIPWDASCIRSLLSYLFLHIYILLVMILKALRPLRYNSLVLHKKQLKIA